MYYIWDLYQEVKKEMEQNTYTKESIRARMYKRVSTLWNISNVELLDPIVKLMIEGLASEIFKLSGNLDDIQDSIAERMAGTLIPTYMMAASPAHAVVHARAADGNFHIPPHMELVYKDPHFIQKYNLRKVSFTPTGVVPVVNGDIAALICQDKYFEISPQGGREHVANFSQKSSTHARTAWIGLELSKEVKDLDHTSFYFEFPFLDKDETYLQLIKHTQWYYNDKPISVTPGCYKGSSDEGVFGLFDQRRYLNEEITAKYSDHFVSLAGSLELNEQERKALPSEIEPLFDEEAFKDLRSDLMWIKIEFPPAFDEIALSQLCVHINCFPISNVYHKQSVLTTNQFTSIIPLEKESNEYFLFMHSVSDSYNNEYKQVENHDDNIAGTYMVKRGGTERFNSLDARDFLERLLDLYRDESIAFSGIDGDITSTASELMENLSDFETKLKSYNDDSEHTAYLIPGAKFPKRTNFNMRYCLTNGPIANDIRTGRLLESPETSDIAPFNIVLMTTTRGGRKSPPQSSRKDIYRYLLATRDRIYTKDDIKMYCSSYHGNCFEAVSVENGYEISKQPGQGFVKVIKVIFTGTNGKSGIDSELLKKEVLAGLKQRSPEDFEYRIIMN